MLYGHGDDKYCQDKIIEHNFSSNVYFEAPDEGLKTVLRIALSELESYPSPDARELNQAASDYFKISPQQFLFTNGATEAFYLITHRFSGCNAVVFGPTFSEYEDACKMHGLSVELAPRNAVLDFRFAHELAFICNPNNPDGAIVTVAQIENLVNNNPKTCFVIDEAYIEFTDKVESCLPILRKYSNLIIVRSLTKTFTIPGLRLGYIIAQEAVIEQLRAFKMPWSVNSLAIAGGCHIFNNYGSLLFDKAKLMQLTADFWTSISNTPGVEPLPTNTSYFLVHLTQGRVDELKSFLVEQHGILIRDASNFKLLEGNYFRIATQTREVNQRLIDALKSWNSTIK